MCQWNEAPGLLFLLSYEEMFVLDNMVYNLL